jgi:hypothetical protein
MSSLVTSASVWTNDEIPANKKRPSTMRKTTKLRPFLPNIGEPEEYNISARQEGLQNQQPETIDDVQAANEDKHTRVSDLLNKITSTDNTAAANSKMGEFKPPPNPEVNVKRDVSTAIAVQPGPAATQRMSAPTSAQQMAYAGNKIEYSNYMNSYGNQPYYAKMGIGSGQGQGQGPGPSVDSKVIEKLNYMIHLLELQQNEKTGHVMEELILYTFLGVFVIFVVDSFARSGKYVR